MSRFIDAEKFVDNFNDEIEMGCSDCAESVHNALSNTPTADVAPIIHGHWIKHEFYEYGCSKCHTANDYKTAYCPSCGAKMDEVVGDD